MRSLVSSSTCIDALFMAVAHCRVMNTIAVSWGFTFAVVGNVLKTVVVVVVVCTLDTLRY